MFHPLFVSHRQAAHIAAGGPIHHYRAAPLASLVGLPIGRHGSVAYNVRVLAKLGALGFDDLQPELSLEPFG